MKNINLSFLKFSWRLSLILVLSMTLFACGNKGNNDGKGSGNEYGSTGQSGEADSIDPSVKAENSKYEVVVYKSPTCGCCQSWIEIMEGLGYRLTVHSDDKQVWQIKRALKIDPTMQSCHTATVEGYVLEGHIHPDSIARLLKERPKIRGLYLPGMIPNSVGMEQPGTKPVRYSILAVDYQNQKAIYDTYQ